MTTLRFLDHIHRGWERAWTEIARRYGSPDCPDPTTGEVWQYMGSTDREHQFRHRALVRGMDPVGYRTYATVPILPEDFDPREGPERGMAEQDHHQRAGGPGAMRTTEFGGGACPAGGAVSGQSPRSRVRPFTGPPALTRRRTYPEA